ncbi:MAG: hypothetical protein ACQES9_03355 [Myxococcota bacterium]
MESSTNKKNEPGMLEYALSWIITGAIAFAIYSFLLVPRNLTITRAFNWVRGAQNQKEKKEKQADKKKETGATKPKEPEAKDADKDKENNKKSSKSNAPSPAKQPVKKPELPPEDD